MCTDHERNPIVALTLWYFNIIIIHIKNKHGVIGRLYAHYYIQHSYRFQFGSSVRHECVPEIDELPVLLLQIRKIIIFFVHSVTWSPERERETSIKKSSKRETEKDTDKNTATQKERSNHGQRQLHTSRNHFIRGKVFFPLFLFVFLSSFNFYQVEHRLLYRPKMANKLFRSIARTKERKKPS